MAIASVNKKFYNQIVILLQTARENAVRAVNQTMVNTYFEIGRMIVEEEQRGEKRAHYGQQLLKQLSLQLTKDYGKGFSVDNLENMRRFYQTYRKSETVFRISSEPNSETLLRNLKYSKQHAATVIFQLSWSHYLILIRIDSEDERRFYEIEAVKNNWSVRELQRQTDSALYARLVLSRNKNKVKELSEKGLVIEQPKDVIKDPIYWSFLVCRNNRHIPKVSWNKR